MVKIGIDVIKALTTRQKELCYKVRYDVFIKETGYIQNVKGRCLETDEYDELDTTFHFLAYNNGVPAGTARLLLPNREIAEIQRTYFGLPIEELFDIKYYITSDLHIAEISRSSVRQRYKSTKTIFYLWKVLIDFATARGVTDLVTNVNPETDKLCDAYQIYDFVKLNDLVDRKIAVSAKKPGIGKIRSFRFPLTSNSCCYYEKNGEEQNAFQLPQTLKLFTRVGILFTGEPVYCEKIDMCAMPMNWRLKDIHKTAFGKFLRRENRENRENAA